MMTTQNVQIRKLDEFFKVSKEDIKISTTLEDSKHIIPTTRITFSDVAIGDEEKICNFFKQFVHGIGSHYFWKYNIKNPSVRQRCFQICMNIPTDKIAKIKEYL